MKLSDVCNCVMQMGHVMEEELKNDILSMFLTALKNASTNKEYERQNILKELGAVFIAYVDIS